MSITQKHHRMKRSWDDIVFKAVCSIFLVLLVIVVFYPLYFVLIASFSDPSYVNRGTPLLFPKGINFDGYREVFRDKRIWSGYVNTILYTVCGTAIGAAIVIPSGYALSRKDLPGRGIIMKLYVFTMYFSGGLIPTYLVVNALGLVNTRASVIVMGCVSVHNMIVVRAFMLNNIPDELLDAARIDGCGNGRFFSQIVLPLSKAVIAVIVLYIAVSYWNSYFNAMIYLTDEGKYPLQLQLRKILLTASAAAASARDEMLEDPEMMNSLMKRVALLKYGSIVVSTAPIICLYPFVQKYFVKGVMIGSVKG